MFVHSYGLLQLDVNTLIIFSFVYIRIMYHGPLYFGLWQILFEGEHLVMDYGI